MILPLLYLAAGISGVFVASLLFTNAIEKASDIMGWGHSFAGSIISPVFTSFPELVVFVFSVFILGGRAGQDIGVGTIIGEPFMASVFAIPVLFLTILASRKISKGNSFVEIKKELYVPFLFMVLLFPVLLLPSFLSIYLERVALGIFLTAAYVAYVYIMVKSRKAETSAEEENDESVYLSRFMSEKKAVIAQSILSLIILIPASSVLVSAVNGISLETGKSAFAISVLVVPVATLLPELIAAVIWAYRGRYTLSMGALIGEEVMYATLYPGISLFIIPWVSGPYLAFSVLSTTIVSFALLASIFKGKVHRYAFISAFAFLILYVILIR